MQDRVADLESRLAAIERRLSALEQASQSERAPEQPELESTLGEGFATNVSVHIGHILLVFGGAYLLRAITESQFVPTAMGILMGAAYALMWLVIADRKARSDAQRTSAAIYAGISVLLALPLLYEAITRFGLLSAGQGVLALMSYCAMTLAVAIMRDLRSLAWLATAGGIVAAVAIVIASHNALAVSVFLIVLGIGSLWAAHARGWVGLQWLGAIGANTGVLFLLLVSNSEQWNVEPRAAAYLGGILLLAYFFSFAIRSFVGRRDVGIFEPVQTLAVCAIVIRAVVGAVQADQLGNLPIGISGIVLGGIAYALSFRAHTQVGRAKDFFFYSSLGLLLVLAGSAFVMSPGAAAVLWSVMALATAWLSGRTGWVSLSLQCTFLLLASGVASGLLATGLQAFVGGSTTSWPALNPLHPAIALTTVACLFIPVAQHSERWGALAGMPQLIVLALSVWEVGGLMIVILAPIVANATGPDPDLAMIAALRTVILSASSVTLALSSRHRRWPEARWLVYPVLILVGLKLFVEDFPNGQPATLFVALAFVGSALLLVAKLLSGGEAVPRGSVQEDQGS